MEYSVNKLLGIRLIFFRVQSPNGVSGSKFFKYERYLPFYYYNLRSKEVVFVRLLPRSFFFTMLRYK